MVYQVWIFKGSSISLLPKGSKIIILVWWIWWLYSKGWLLPGHPDKEKREICWLRCHSSCSWTWDATAGEEIREIRGCVIPAKAFAKSEVQGEDGGMSCEEPGESAVTGALSHLLMTLFLLLWGFPNGNWKGKRNMHNLTKSNWWKRFKWSHS